MVSRVLLAVLVIGVLSGCISADDEGGDDVPPVTDAAFAVFDLPETLTGLEMKAALDLGAGGNGIWIDEERALLLSSNGGGGFAVVDIKDPEHPVELGRVADVEYARDVDLVTWDNRSFAVLAAASEGIHVVDITNASDPRLVVTADKYASHNLAVLPGTPYVYDSSGFQPEKLIPVLDLSVPEKPVWHVIEIPLVVNGLPTQTDGCHDITFRPELKRGYCAGGGSYYVAGGAESLIMDMTDPLKPTFIGVVDNPSIMYHHQALASEDGNLLFINDEFLAPNCQSIDTPIGPVGQTTAAMWVYDISDPASPELLSWVQPSHTPTSINCGSHFGDTIDGTSHLVWGWYGGGTLLIDVTDPASPVIKERADAGGSTWDARYFNGHVYGSSGQLQVFRVV